MNRKRRAANSITDASTLRVGHARVHFGLEHTPPDEAIDVYRQMIRRLGDPTDWPEGALTRDPRAAPRLLESARYVPINLFEKRLHTVEQSLSELRQTVAELRDVVGELGEALRVRPLVLSNEIVDLSSEGYSLRRPIPIVIEESEEETVASFPETETYGSGSTPSEAIGELKRQIASLYDDLANSDPGEFGKLPAAWWRILQYYVSKQ